MTKIFLTIPWFSPAFKAGGPIRSIENMINSVQGEIQFFIFTSDADINNEKLKGIKKDVWIAYKKNTNVYYASSLNRSNRLIKECEKVKPDLIFITGIYSWHYTGVPLFFCKAPRSILSVRGMLHPEALQQQALKKNLYLSFLRLMNVKQRTSFHATNATEADYISEVFGKKSRVKILQNIPTLFEPVPGKEKRKGALSLLTICLISPMKNIHLVLQALQQCKADIQYDIYGIVKNIKYWEICRGHIAQLPGNIKVTFHGEIAQAGIPGLYKEAHVFIQPSESENFGHSIAEALSAGLPVITSHNTPWQELAEHSAGKNVERNPEALTGAINFFAEMEQAEYSNWHQSAANYLREKINSTEIISSYEKLFSTDG